MEIQPNSIVRALPVVNQTGEYSSHESGAILTTTAKTPDMPPADIATLASEQDATTAISIAKSLLESLPLVRLTTWAAGN